MHVCRPDNKENYVNQISIFLAGPTHRGVWSEKIHWREKAIKVLKEYGFKGVVFSPEPFSVSYEDQVEWEDRRLNEATVIAFWIPRDLTELPGFTTNVEFGEWMKSGKVVLGYPKGAEKMRYLKSKAEKFNIPLAETLEETLRLALTKI